MRKPDFCICENKDADQLRGIREADQRLCFRYTDSTIPLLPKSEISSLWPSSLAVQPGLWWTWSETPKTGFLTTRLKYVMAISHTSRKQLCTKYDPKFAPTTYEPRSEKTGLRGFRQGPTKTRLCNHRRWLEA